ncbi:MAG: hypothetical protein K1000chlam3_01118 [Chlamydiae bacterium]|nr:hypothetical protein [Chlamydiota bacterium]
MAPNKITFLHTCAPTAKKKLAGVHFFTNVKNLKGTEILLPKNLERGEAAFSSITYEGKILPAM